MLGGFSLVDKDYNEVRGGPVYNLGLSSYSTELWALVVAIRTCTCPTSVYTDCQTIVTQFAELQQSAKLDLTWSHLTWWQAIYDRWFALTQVRPSPFQVCWIPSHLFEHLPEVYITDAMASSKGTEVHHIMCNRFADCFAKSHALHATSIHPLDEQLLKRSIVQRQDWLTNLNRLIALLQRQDQDLKLEARLEAEAESENMFALFPRWDWGPKGADFPWRPQTSIALLPLHDLWKDRASSWNMLASFFDQLQWRTHATALTSYVELAVLFYLKGFLLPEHDPDQQTFRDLTAEIRQFIAHVRTQSDDAIPGKQNRHRNKSVGRSLPNGTIDGAEVFFSKPEKVRFARILAGVLTARLAAWEFTFGSAEA